MIGHCSGVMRPSPMIGHQEGTLLPVLAGRPDCRRPERMDGDLVPRFKGCHGQVLRQPRRFLTLKAGPMSLDTAPIWDQDSGKCGQKGV